MVDLIWLIPIFPLIGAVLMLFIGRHLPKAAVNVICVGSVFLSFLLSAGAVLESHGRTHEVILFQWLPLLKADVGYLLDPLSSVMILVVTGIGALIHLYSVGYMAHEGGYYRFFGYLNLFVFFMLTLVLANNYALLFVGWEGVGLCSYLLIGFYIHKKSAGDAGKKAFIVNRIGDWGFLMGLFLLWNLIGTVRFTEVGPALHQFQPEATFGVLSIAALCMFIGATGKSAQFPLYVWLPDAMEGPTPVSALIHAATMVTAGVYMVARSSALFHLTPMTLDIIAAVGAFTAIFAATIGLVQNDIKRVLAYSTVSQLGFMFMALGVGAYWVAVFHLVTHAFFKALLFLGSGSVIHGMHHEQDMRKMGGLKKYMPVTHATMLIGSLAIAGVPGLAGFFSKEEILTSAFMSAKAVYVVGLITAVMTAFYMFRLMRMTFYGKERFDRHHVHPHESPWTMTVVLGVLAAGSVLIGWTNAGIVGIHAFSHWLEPVFPKHEAHHPDSGTLAMLLALALSAAGIGIFVALRTSFAVTGALGKVLLNKWYVDEIYDFLFVNGLSKGGGLLLGSFDRNVVDGGVNGAAWLTRLNSRAMIWWDTWIVDGAVRLTGFAIRLLSYPTRLAQTGQVQTYALFFIVGVLVMFGLYVTRS
jgi:NADH-quinone oxidoreductase subunit L